MLGTADQHIFAAVFAGIGIINFLVPDCLTLTILPSTLPEPDKKIDNNRDAKHKHKAGYHKKQCF